MLPPGAAGGSWRQKTLEADRNGHRGEGEGKGGDSSRGRTGSPCPDLNPLGSPPWLRAGEEKEGTVLAGRGERFSPWAP